MTEEANRLFIETAAVSDRGLSEKRPLNEDSFYSDPQRRLFAVADGVGGANAGEVASQTAMEVLSEAFRHSVEDADIEDLMELAIQRANASIHQMAQEHPKFSMMATTVVALHLDGYRATIGHVGDSRLYRLTPDGRLLRETADHSVVEEEVRAGRMTEAQAANHPSRNIISRALGAEDGVEVDLKTLEFEDGTTFLLCSDGITRHIPDNELRELLTSGQDLESICEEMKRRCYERGAEDNLTAVIVRARAQGGNGNSTFDEEATILTARPPSGEDSQGASHTSSTGETVEDLHTTVPYPPAAESTAPATRAVDRLMAGSEAATSSINAPIPAARPAPTVVAAPPRRGIVGKLLGVFFALLFAGVVGAAAFYGGKYVQRQIDQTSPPVPVATALPTPAAVATENRFEKQLRAVDVNPLAEANRLATENNGKPLESSDPEFLYLYGRALLLSGKYEESVTAFEQAITQLNASAPPEHPSLKADVRFGLAAAALKLDRSGPRLRAFNEIDAVIQKENQPGAAAQPNGSQQPEASQPVVSVSP